MEKSVLVRRGVTVAFWWFMIVSRHPGGTLTAATQGPFAMQAQCDWARQQIGITTGLRGGQGVGGYDATLERRAVGGALA